MIASVAEMRVVVDNTDAQERAEELRILEALLFAAEEPLDEKALAGRLPAGVDVRALLMQLQNEYEPRGVNLVRVGGKWSLRTASDLAWLLTREMVVTKKLSRAAIETLAIVAYHQPVTRAEIEDIRGVTTSKGTLDVLLENRTAILIAHRLSTAMRADRIVVVDDGRIVEVGSHDELVARGGRYAEMYATWVRHTESTNGSS